MKKVVIVGGGISGLTVAFALINGNQTDVTVLESESRPGGKIWTDRADGFLCEKGTNGFLDNKPRTLDLCKKTGLEPVSSNENARRRFIFSDGKLNPLPESPLSFLKSELLSWRGKLRMLYELVAPKGPEDETVADFITRRLGRESLEKLIDPMCSGVYAGDPYKMSIKSSFPRIKELEQEYGSLIRAMIRIQRERKRTGGRKTGPSMSGNLTSFYNGADTITNALADRLGNRVRLGVAVKGIERDGSSYVVHTSEGTEQADIVVLASPAYASAGILQWLDAGLSKIISGIPYSSVSVVCFGYKREKVDHPLKGFGFLVPHVEGRKILGSLWDSSIFPNRAPEGSVLLRTIVGGTRSPELAMQDDDHLIRSVFDELKPVVCLKGEPDMVRVYRWEKAIPQYVTGHSVMLTSIESALSSYPGLFITGNAYRGISMNDCIENGYRVAEEILRFTS
ncbi:MAG TPA: protoporphyrinogen oxidase [Nitrospirae bacterium]|nr:protoporphyrinogen oxidase [Nitrospirota bacterium]